MGKINRLVDDTSGAIFDVVKLICYFLAGGLIVSAVLYAITGILNITTTLFF